VMDVTERLIDVTASRPSKSFPFPPPDASAAPSVYEQSAHKVAHDPANPEHQSQPPPIARLFEGYLNLGREGLRLWAAYNFAGLTSLWLEDAV